MDSHVRSVRSGRLAASLSSLMSGGLAHLPFRSRRCVTTTDAVLEPLDDDQLAQVAGGLDSPFLPDDDWSGSRR
jgi:hypothetical protein